jgi:1-aminocyclopropane-1-carboxylate deaminase
MLTEIRKPGLTNIKDPLFSEKGIRLDMLRLDRIHPDMGGNKWYKLKYNLEAASRLGSPMIVSCGGAWSNHIAALAAAGYYAGIPTGAIIRGEEAFPLNPTLAKASAQGMKWCYASRDLYRDKTALEKKARDYFGDDIFWIPEGGSNQWGIIGCTEILQNLEIQPDVICCACGTGTTAAGMAASAVGKNKIMGFPAIRTAGFGMEEIEGWIGEEMASQIRFILDYHFGGYAKTTPELIRFVDLFFEKQRVQLDYIYTGKMMFGIYDLISRDFFAPGTRILAIHTGGVQGNAGIAINR